MRTYSSKYLKRIITRKGYSPEQTKDAKKELRRRGRSVRRIWRCR